MLKGPDFPAPERDFISTAAPAAPMGPLALLAPTEVFRLAAD